MSIHVTLKRSIHRTPEHQANRDFIGSGGLPGRQVHACFTDRLPCLCTGCLPGRILALPAALRDSVQSSARTLHALCSHMHYVHASLRACVCLCVTCMHTCIMCVHVQVCLCACVSVCMHAHVCLCVCVYTYMYVEARGGCQVPPSTVWHLVSLRKSHWSWSWSGGQQAPV